MVTLSLVVLAVLAAVGPATAHPTVPVVAPPVLATPDPMPDPPALPVDSGARESPGIASWLLTGALLLSLTVGIESARRRPRRALVLALIFMLTLFAFENALHSVHHGLDAKQGDECTVAAAAGHLSAVSVDGVLETSVILVATERTVEPDPAPPSTRHVKPVQSRAPPFATA